MGHPDRTEDYAVQYDSPEAAIRHFVRDEVWRYYARRFDENHGLPAESRVSD